MRAGAGVHQDSPGTTQTRGISAPVPNYAMFDSLLAALCDPLIPARVMTVGVPQKGVNSMSDPVSVKNAARLTVILAVYLCTAYVRLD